MSVKIIRLSTGEELIATVKSEVNGVLTIENVSILIPTQQNSLGLAPFLAYAEFKELVLNPKDYMFVVVPVEGLLNQYQEMFTQVITPTKKIIV